MQCAKRIVTEKIPAYSLGDSIHRCFRSLVLRHTFANAGCIVYKVEHVSILVHFSSGITMIRYQLQFFSHILPQDLEKVYNNLGMK